MADSTKKELLQITEVPPELRGLSDEEIIKNSESKEKKFIGKRHNGARRPSKRERLAQKNKAKTQSSIRSSKSTIRWKSRKMPKMTTTSKKS